MNNEKTYLYLIQARNIEYKDPIEEEWERYQKAIAEETNVSF